MNCSSDGETRATVGRSFLAKDLQEYGGISGIWPTRREADEPAWTVMEMAIRHDDIKMSCLKHYTDEGMVHRGYDY